MSIKVDNVFYIHDEKTPNESKALNGVSLTIESGSFVAFVGKTGSGKSTLMQLFNNLLTPKSGEIQVDDYLITANKKHNKKNKLLRKHIGLVFQFPEYQLFEETVEKDVAFGLRNFGEKEDTAISKAHEALLSVGLDESYFKRSPFELSGGEKRRVAIAGIIAMDPDILILDEPTVGLDPLGAKNIMSLITTLREKGKTIIVVTHNMDLVLHYCDKVFVLDEGKVIYEGDPIYLFQNLDTYKSSVEIPPLYYLAKRLIDRGMKFDFNHLRSIDDLVKQIKEQK